MPAQTDRIRKIHFVTVYTLDNEFLGYLAGRNSESFVTPALSRARVFVRLDSASNAISSQDKNYIYRRVTTEIGL